MRGSTLKSVGALALLVACALYFDYGTLSPCAALRETVRNQDSLARLIPDSIVDAIIEGNIGSLSPGRCIGALLKGQPLPAPPVAVASASSPTKAISARVNTSEMQIAGNETVAAISECRSKRLSGEIKTFVQSAQCSNPRIVHAYSKANYRYMDLIQLMVAKRLQISGQLDRNEITEAAANVATQQAFSARDAGRSR